MQVLGAKIKAQNIFRSVLLLAIAIIWRILSGDNLQPTKIDPYVFPVIGFFIAALIFGELTRKVYQTRIRKIEIAESSTLPDEQKLEEDREDRVALNFGIVWGIVWMIISVI